MSIFLLCSSRKYWYFPTVQGIGNSWGGVGGSWRRKNLSKCIKLDWNFERGGVQGCTLRKIEGSPELWTCEIQGAPYMICMKNKGFLVTQEQKLGATGHRALLEYSPGGLGKTPFRGGGMANFWNYTL